MNTNCPFCSSELAFISGRTPRACLSARVRINEPEKCWQENGNRIQKLCVLSAPHNRVTSSKKRRVYQLLKLLGIASLKGQSTFEKYFTGLSGFERHDLIEFAVDELREKLTTIAANHALTIFPYPDMPDLPDDLSPEFFDIIHAYREMLLTRYERLLEKGHQRSNYYVSRESSDAIRFLKYLNKSGYITWTGIGRKQLVAYLADENAKLSNSLKRFIKYANNKKNPLRKIKTGKPKHSGTVLTETPRPKIVPPEMVDKLLQSIKTNYSSPEYLLAWLVCRMGLTLKKAHGLNLAQVQINDNGRCVIKPAEVWVSLPAGIGNSLIELANKSFPRWETETTEKLEYQELFSKEIPNRVEFGQTVLQGHSRELRTSAIFALMQKGHTDRVTIKRTTGMSMPTIVKLESLFSVDMHRRLAPEFIKLRNQHILGEVKE